MYLMYSPRNIVHDIENIVVIVKKIEISSEYIMGRAQSILKSLEMLKRAGQNRML